MLSGDKQKIQEFLSVMWKAEKEKQLLHQLRRNVRRRRHARWAAIMDGLPMPHGELFQPLMDLNRYWADISVGGPDFEEKITVAEIMADNIRKYISSMSSFNLF